MRHQSSPPCNHHIDDSCHQRENSRASHGHGESNHEGLVLPGLAPEGRRNPCMKLEKDRVLLTSRIMRNPSRSFVIVSGKMVFGSAS